MKNNQNNTNMKSNLLYSLVATLVLLLGCDNMHDSYKNFIKDGEIVYVGIADSIQVFPGNNRLKLNFLISDPSASKVSILWNNKTDSLIIPIERVHQIDTINIELTDLQEGAYSFNIIVYDDENNSSITTYANGNVYGENYTSSLLNTPVREANVNKNNKTLVDVIWGASDETAIGSEIVYTDLFNNLCTYFAPPEEKSTVLKNYCEGTSFQHRTLYLPEETAIDTFYTAYETTKVRGAAIEYNKSTWIATGNCDGNRTPQNAIDNNINTVWHMDKTKIYPHSMVVDMGEINTISGFSFIQRGGGGLMYSIKLIEMQISDDGDKWSSLGEFTLEKIEPKQYVDLDIDYSCRYFKLIAKSDYNNGAFTALSEIGAYKR
jgi:hypothetical protein